MSSPEEGVRSRLELPVGAELTEQVVAVVREYARRFEDGDRRPPIAARDDLSATEVALFCSQLLEASEISPFELAMWSSWSV